MPTHEETDVFRRDFNSLGVDDMRAFRAAVKDFFADLRSRHFRQGLRVKGINGAPGIFEMSWARGDGRATFQYGHAVKPGETHIIWRRVGRHEIFKQP